VNQNQLAEMTNVASNSILRIERGLLMPGSTYLDWHLQCPWNWCWLHLGGIHRSGYAYSMDTLGRKATICRTWKTAQNWSHPWLSDKDDL